MIDSSLKELKIQRFIFQNKNIFENNNTKKKLEQE